MNTVDNFFNMTSGQIICPDHVLEFLKDQNYHIPKRPNITINSPSPLTQVKFIEKDRVPTFRSAVPSFVVTTDTPKKKSILKRLFTPDKNCRDMR